MHYEFHKVVNSCSYTIDMLYIQGYLTDSFKSVLEHLKTLCKSPTETFHEYKGQSRYSWFQYVFKFGKLSISIGLFSDFDKVDRSWTVLPMAEIRFNPNTCYGDYYKTFIDYFMQKTDSRWIRKFDFACDIQIPMSDLLVCSNRQLSTVKNCETLYYGDKHNDKALKIYDKTKEREDNADEKIDGDLTRIELSCKTSGLDSWINEKFYIVPNIGDLDSDSALNDTDKAILRMFFRLRSYEPNLSIDSLCLGRKKEKKIKEFLLSSSPSDSSSASVGFDKTLCIELLDLVSVRYDCSIKATNKQLLTSAPPTLKSANGFEACEDLPLPFRK